MPIDLNEARRYGVFDAKVIEAALRLHAAKWVPLVFPHGRKEPEAEGIGWRVADISGRRPKDDGGSCRVWMTGDHAGEWYEFENKKGGQVFSTIKERFDLDEGQAISKAIEILQEIGVDLATVELPAEKPKANGHDNSREAWSLNKSFNYWLQGKSCIGTLAETYWRARKLGDLPPAAFGSFDGDGPDMKFIDFAANSDLGGKGVPAIVHRFRFPSGELTNAVQLTYLRNDGSWHIGPDFPDKKRIAKKTFGPRDQGGLVMLAPINDRGELGIGEGVESTAAGIRYHNVGGWAACGTAAMLKFAQWVATADPAQIAHIKRLLFWGDAGKGGERTLFETAALARTRIPVVECYLPRSGDDMAKDLALGYGPPEPLTPDEIEALATAVQPALPLAPTPADGSMPVPAGPPFLPQGPAWLPPHSALPVPALAAPATALPTKADIDARVLTLNRQSDPGDVIAVCRMIAAAADMQPIERDSAINTISRKTDIPKKTIKEEIKKINTEIILPRNNEEQGTHYWLDKMALGLDGDPKGIMSNVAIVLRELPEWRGVLWFDEFTQEIWFHIEPPYSPNAGKPCHRKWAGESDELATTEWMQAVGGIHAPKHVVFDAVLLVASERKYHQVRDYLSSVVWDGVSRWDNFSITYLGYDHTAPTNETTEEKEERVNRDTYVRAAMRKWAIGAVARAFQPGVKNDAMPILVGPQGYGKSTAIKKLVGEEWFTDDMPEFGTKDAAIQLNGIWVAELSELDSMRGTVLSRAKAFASRQTDRYRPPYGRKPIDMARQCVFFGTVNETEFLRDTTGNRRYWPIPISKRIDTTAIERDRDQLWAEAVHLFRSGEKWYFDHDSEIDVIKAAEIEQEARRQHDSWEKQIADYLDGNTPNNDLPLNQVSTDDILINALYISDRSKWGKGEEMRVGKILQKLGWSRKQVRLADGIRRAWRYVRPPPEPSPGSGDASPPEPIKT